jgi:ABC-type branched-subunit amino acid transport system ATPase component
MSSRGTEDLHAADSDEQFAACCVLTCRVASARRELKKLYPISQKYQPSVTTGFSPGGGQQQMLAVAQGLVRRPKLLMLDEPSAGLSPLLVDRVMAVVSRLREAGTAVLLVEQLIDKALAVANRVYALAQGNIVLEAPTSEPDLPHRLERAYFGHHAERLHGDGGIASD